MHFRALSDAPQPVAQDDINSCLRDWNALVWGLQFYSTSRGEIMRIMRWGFIAAALVAGVGGISLGAQQQNVDQVVDRITQRENDEVAIVRQYNPVVETYVQDMQPDQIVGTVPTADHYFLGRLNPSSNLYAPELSKKDKKKQQKHEAPNLGALSGVFDTDSILNGFLQAIYVDPNGFDRQHYRF